MFCVDVFCAVMIEKSVWYIQALKFRSQQAARRYSRTQRRKLEKGRSAAWGISAKHMRVYWGALWAVAFV